MDLRLADQAEDGWDGPLLELEGRANPGVTMSIVDRWKADRMEAGRNGYMLALGGCSNIGVIMRTVDRCWVAWKDDG